MEKDKNNIIVKFVSTNRNFSPSFTETQNYEYILFGKDNDLPYLLIDLYGSVSLHKGIIEKKKNMIIAGGLELEEGKNFNKALDFYENPNNNDNFEELWNKVVNDYLVFGGSYLQVVWSVDGKTINKISHMPFETMRSGKANDEGIVDEYFYNPDRSKAGKYKKYTKSNDLIKFPAFSQTSNKKEAQIYYIKSYDVSSFYYGLPDYSSAITDLDTLRSISVFHNSNISNGLQPSYVVMFPGPKPSNDAQDKIVKQIKEKYSGIENAGKPLIFFMDGSDKVPTIETIEASDVDKMYEILHNTTTGNVITSHQIPRVLANVATEGSLGGSKEYTDSEIVFNNTYIKPVQEFLLSKINIIFDINKYPNLGITPVATDLAKYSIDELMKLYPPEQVISLLGLPDKEVVEVKPVEPVSTEGDSDDVAEIQMKKNK